MNESDRRQRVISSTPRLSTDEIANQFVRQGRARLQRDRGPRVPEARVRGARAPPAGTSRSSRRAIDTLEEQVRTPRPLTEQELLDALGEETARLLRSAREASDDIRTKAEERAARTGRGSDRRPRNAPAPRPPSCSRRAPRKPRRRSTELVATARRRARRRCSTPPRPKPRRSSRTRGVRVARCSTRRRRRASVCSAISFAAARC